MDDRDWTRLVEQIQSGDCTPFLGAGASSTTMPLGSELSSQLAEQYGYPFPDTTNLASVAQFAAVVERDAVTVKRRVANELADRGLPDFSNPVQPHRLLAGHPISVYITTNYDDFMTRALQLARKDPRTHLCPWYPGADDDPAASPLARGYQPSPDIPLVYHLHGSFERPPSLVLTDEDYLEFLITLAKDRASARSRLVPTQVLPAMTQKPLLFLGYSLRDWSFRTLFQGLRSTISTVGRRRHVSVQLSPLPEADAGTRKRAEDYLRKQYDRWDISLHWGPVDEFCSELAERLARR